jgi:hypothetical protein
MLPRVRRADDPSIGSLHLADACAPRAITREDWSLLLSTRANALLIASETAQLEVLRAWRPYMQPPVYVWDTGMPAPSAAVRTVIFLDVASLTAARQTIVHRWIDSAAGSPRILSFSATPIYDLVTQGLFLEELYYRLNTVHVVNSD